MSPLRTLGRRLRQNLARAIDWFRRQEGTPGHQARGLALGVFIGCLPIFGFQMLLGAGLAGPMRGNRILAVAGTWVSNPVTNLPLFWLNYQLGTLLMGPGPAWTHLQNFTPRSLAQVGWDFTSRLFLGSVLVGALIAAASGLGCWRWLEYRRRRRMTTPPR